MPLSQTELDSLPGGHQYNRGAVMANLDCDVVHSGDWGQTRGSGGAVVGQAIVGVVIAGIGWVIRRPIRGNSYGAVNLFDIDQVARDGKAVVIAYHHQDLISSGVGGWLGLPTVAGFGPPQRRQLAFRFNNDGEATAFWAVLTSALQERDDAREAARTAEEQAEREADEADDLTAIVERARRSDSLVPSAAAIQLFCAFFPAPDDAEPDELSSYLDRPLRFAGVASGGTACQYERADDGCNTTCLLMFDEAYPDEHDREKPDIEYEPMWLGAPYSTNCFCLRCFWLLFDSGAKSQRDERRYIEELPSFLNVAAVPPYADVLQELVETRQIQSIDTITRLLPYLPAQPLVDDNQTTLDL